MGILFTLNILWILPQDCGRHWMFSSQLRGLQEQRGGRSLPSRGGAVRGPVILFQSTGSETSVLQDVEYDECVDVEEEVPIQVCRVVDPDRTPVVNREIEGSRKRTGGRRTGNTRRPVRRKWNTSRYISHHSKCMNTESLKSGLFTSVIFPQLYGSYSIVNFDCRAEFYL